MKRRARARAIGMVAMTIAAAGCGRAPEATRFVPAEAAGSDRPSSAPERARPEVRKIEMH